MNCSLPTILHVEDNANDVLLLQHAAEKVDVPFHLEAVSDGEQAISYLSGRGIFSERQRYPLPALILLDTKLPRQSGFAVLEWIRSNPELKQLPVVMWTSMAQEEDMKHAYEIGANSFVIKSLQFQQLVQQVQCIADHWLKCGEAPARG